MPLSDSGAHAMLNASLGDAHASTWPATVYLALSTTDPAASVTEPTGNQYARQGIANTTAQWPAASSRQKKNANAVTFPAANPSGWGTIGYYALYDSLSGGTMLAYGSLTAATTINSGDTASVAANGIVVQIT